MEDTIFPHGESLAFHVSHKGERQADAMQRNIIASWVVWLTVTRAAKLLPHLWQHPAHIIYVPAWILFAYYL